ncbi:hypothetical protein AB0F13_14870 [Streptomyces sp. NPDC026206]|uniref:hypothetical protein n=1 Tax=Streptomyces sp. NPDC026206 TaxID=3157089 RepID=UPI0033F57AF8
MPHTPEQASEASHAPARGELVWDTTTNRVGEVMDNRWSRCQLRPPAGGTEWHAAPENLVSVTVRRPRCEECGRIKDAYYTASREGDGAAAAHWATAMGLHQRAAHA